MTDAVTGSDVLERAQPRVLRHVAPPDAPWPAALVRADGGNALLVDTAHLPDWVVRAGGAHVAAPMEIVRTSHGHAALMPELAEPLVARAQVTTGGAITLAVSILRGIRGAGAADADGVWWLAHDGRPVLVPVVDAGPASEAAAELLDEVSRMRGETLFAEVAEALRSGEGLDSPYWESRLFALGPAAPVSAAPAPTDTVPAPATRRSAHGAHDGTATGMRRREMPPREPTLRERGTTALAELVDVVRRRLDGMRGPSRGRAADRRGAETASASDGRRGRGMIAVAGIAAAAVVVIGLLWPTGDGSVETTDGGAPVATSPGGVAATTSAGGAEPAEGAPSGGLTERATEVLDAARRCSDADCRADVFEDLSLELPPGPIRDGGELTVSVIDDLGGIAVVRAEAAAAPGEAQIAVLVSRDGKWLVRDVYDAAHQP